MVRYRILTLEEREQIEKMVKIGLSHREIARRIKRSNNCISNEIGMNGGNANYNALQAQNHANQRRIATNQNLCEFNKKKRKKTTWYSRIENLEMQVEILSEYIQGLTNGS